MPRTQSSEAVVAACRLLSSEESIETREVANAVGLSDSIYEAGYSSSSRVERKRELLRREAEVEKP